jgi:hypothetical protein
VALTVLQCFTDSSGNVLVSTQGGTYPLLPPTGDTGFTVLVNGATTPIISSTAVQAGRSTRTIKLNLATTISFGDTFVVSYTPGNVTDSASVSLTAFSSQPGINLVGLTSASFNSSDTHLVYGNVPSLVTTNIGDGLYFSVTARWLQLDLSSTNFSQSVNVSVDGTVTAWPITNGLLIIDLGTQASHDIQVTQNVGAITFQSTGIFVAYGSSTPTLAITAGLSTTYFRLVDAAVGPHIYQEGAWSVQAGQYWFGSGGSWVGQKLWSRATCTDFVIWMFCAGQTIRLMIDGVDQNNPIAVPNTQAFGWVTLSTGLTLDGTAEHEYRIWFTAHGLGAFGRNEVGMIMLVHTTPASAHLNQTITFPQNATVLILGDSITDCDSSGAGLHNPVSGFYEAITGWGRQLAVLRNMDEFNFGVGGTSAPLTTAQKTAIAAMPRAPRYVIYNYGENMIRPPGQAASFAAWQAIQTNVVADINFLLSTWPGVPIFMMTMTTGYGVPVSTVVVGANSATQQVVSTAHYASGGTNLYFETVGVLQAISSVIDGTHVALTGPVNTTTGERVNHLGMDEMTIDVVNSFFPANPVYLINIHGADTLAGADFFASPHVSTQGYNKIVADMLPVINGVLGGGEAVPKILFVLGRTYTDVMVGG